MWQGRWLNGTNRVNCVAIVGGTHGNEANGVYLQRALRAAKVRGEGFEVLCVEANGESIRANTRYIQEDLNRCFSSERLSGAADTVEQRRALQINEMLGPKDSDTPRADLVIDLHNTTANTGVALMFHPRDEFSHSLGAHLQRLDPSVRLCNWVDDEPALLPSVGRSGMTFEVGPAPWGVIVPELFANSLRLLQAALSYVAAHNASVDGSAPLPCVTREVDVYTRIRDVPFPRHASGDQRGDIAAMLHPRIHGGDFGRLKRGDPLFQRWDGSEIAFDGPESGDDLTFFFANEAAYYEKDVALALARRTPKSVDMLLLG